MAQHGTGSRAHLGRARAIEEEIILQHTSWFSWKKQTSFEAHKPFLSSAVRTAFSILMRLMIKGRRAMLPVEQSGVLTKAEVIGH